MAAVNRYVAETFALNDPVLEEILRSTESAGLPDIQIGPEQGRFLEIMARLVGAKRIVEIGALAGYSTVWLARGLGDGGTLISLEIDPARAALARQNVERAGLADRVDVRAGPALESLQMLAAEGGAPVDLVFMDADEPNYVAYLELVLNMSRPGTLVIADNVIRDGDVVDPQTSNARAQGARQFNEVVAGHPRLLATLIPLVGETNLDGMAVAVVVN
jgi:predicted O-methyltransferase YrrM